MVGEDVLADDVESRSTLRDVGADSRSVRERTAVGSVLVLEEVEQRIITVVANAGVAGPAPIVGSIKTVANVLLNLPGDACRLQPLGVGRPPIAECRIVDHSLATIPNDM